MMQRWSDRQFVGGTVALDLANTVCYRGDPARQFDKISGPEELSAFAWAALAHSDAGGWSATAPDNGDSDIRLPFYRAIRESIDELFRPAAEGESPATACFAALLRFHHDLLGGRRIRVAASGIELDPTDAPSFALIVTQSALRLAVSAELLRLKICPNCRWLFIDRSRNSSRIWCDMLTCGNRAKAERFYGRRREANR